jgi:hypothetical protein
VGLTRAPGPMATGHLKDPDIRSVIRPHGRSRCVTPFIALRRPSWADHRAVNRCSDSTASRKGVVFLQLDQGEM